jgi:hypothetical protein
MDGDDQYVYMLKSGYGSSNTNVILAVDWNGPQLIDNSTGFRREYVGAGGVGEQWDCNYGKVPLALYTINTPYEAENVFHIYDFSGNQIFYMSEYDANQQYSVTKEKKAYKVKWKKVKKKVKVLVTNSDGTTKWVKKKVTKYKYVWKKKKVWKYKTKYKTVTVKTPTHKERQDYVYPLGIL